MTSDLRTRGMRSRFVSRITRYHSLAEALIGVVRGCPLWSLPHCPGPPPHRVQAGLLSSLSGGKLSFPRDALVPIMHFASDEAYPPLMGT